MLRRKLLETKESSMPLLPLLSGWKTEKYSRKKKLRKRLIIILLISVPTWLSPFPKAKRDSNTNSLRGSLPRYHQSYRLRTGKCIWEPEKKQKFRLWWYICRCCHKSVPWNICYSETYFQYIFSRGNLLRQTKTSSGNIIKGNSTLVTNYRSTSVLPVFLKIIWTYNI